MRKNAEEKFQIIYTLKIVQQFGIVPELPRRVGSQKYRSNYQTSDRQKYYRAALFIKFLEEIMSSMTNRFSDHGNEIKDLYNIVHSRVVDVSSKEFCSIIEFYKNYLKYQKNVILAEVDLWRQLWKNKEFKP